MIITLFKSSLRFLESEIKVFSKYFFFNFYFIFINKHTQKKIQILLGHFTNCIN